MAKNKKGMLREKRSFRGDAFVTDEKPKLTGSVKASLLEQEATANALEAATEVALVQSSKARRMSSIAAKTVAGAEALYNAAKSKNSRAHVAGIDMAGSISGVLSFEALNWVLRKIGKWSPAFAEQIDYWQSLPHLVVGIIVYWVELLTRKPDASGSKIFPSMPREIAHEWSKVFFLLGANNLWRAIRVRGKDQQQQLAELAAVKAEREALKGKLATYEKPERG